MSTARQKRKPVFDPSALDDDLDDLWPARPTDPAAPQAAPAAEPIATAPATPPASERPSTAGQPPAAPQHHAGERGRTGTPVADAGNETDQRRSQRSASTPCQRDCGTRVGPETDPPT